MHPAYVRIRAATSTPTAEDSAEVDRLAQDALARVRRTTSPDTDTAPDTDSSPGQVEIPAARWSLRSFVMNTEMLATWWDHYDPAELAAKLTDEQLEMFFTAAEPTTRFADELHAARTHESDDATNGRAHLRAI